MLLFVLLRCFLRDGGKGLNKQRNYWSCLGIFEAESKSLWWLHKDPDTPYSLSEWTKEGIREWDAEPRHPVCSGPQVDMGTGGDGRASLFAPESPIWSERTEKLVTALSADYVSGSLSRSTQGVTEPCSGTHVTADDNRDGRTGSGKNQSPGGSRCPGQQWFWDRKNVK